MSSIGLSRCGRAVAVAAAGLLLNNAPALAQTPNEDFQPAATAGVGITEKLTTALPLNLELTDENGGKVHLGDYFQTGRPVILTFNYYSCPMLCTVMLNGLVDGLKEMPLVPGTDYEIVTLSFNPSEGPQLAKAKLQNYLKYWNEGDPTTSAPIGGWHFLTAGQREIEELTSAAGFTYRWDEETQQYVHSAAAIFCTPDGRISRYLYGVKYEPDTVKLTLIEASKGRIGTPVDQVILYCFQYDAASGSYVPVAMQIMKLGGLATLIILAFFLASLWQFDRNRRKRAGQDSMNLREKHV